MNKKEFRSRYLAKRRELGSMQIEEMSRQITEHFLTSEFVVAQTFHIFLHVEKLREINTSFLIEALWKAGKTVVVPKMEGKKLLHCAFGEATELERNSWGINEPKNCQQLPLEQLDVVVVPLLVCDVNGNRIGYGGGYYDRFMSGLKKEMKLVGISFFDPVEHLPSESYDVPLDAVVTPDGIIHF